MIMKIYYQISQMNLNTIIVEKIVILVVMNLLKQDLSFYPLCTLALVVNLNQRRTDMLTLLFQLEIIFFTECSNRSRSDVTRSSDTRVTIDEWVEATLGESTSNDFPFLPTQEPGINTSLINEPSSVLDCFSLLFDDEIINNLIDCINSYAENKIMQNTPMRRRSRYHDWHPVSKYDIYKFFAAIFAMGINKRPALNDFFSTIDLFYTPFFGELFLILFFTMLHCGEANAEGKNKVEPFINKVIQKFNIAFTPYQQDSIDEMIVGFKGRWQYKLFNPSKPSKYHIKSFGLVDSSTGYVINLLTYYGKNTSFDPEVDTEGGQAIQIFCTLLKYLGKGYHIFADRYYTTRNLVDFLTNEKFLYTGTIQSNRLGFPPQVKNANIKHMESKYWMTQNKQKLVVLWKDKYIKKPVIMVSTSAQCLDVLVKHKSKPSMVDKYNKFMFGCDLADQKIGYYGLHARKSTKWWKKLFLWIMEIACSNADVLYNLSRPDHIKKSFLSLKQFKIKLVDLLCAEASTLMPQEEKEKRKISMGCPRINPLARLSGGRHIIDIGDKQRRCKVCSNSKPVWTLFFCMDCPDQPALHPKDCFKIWHTQAII
uniref:Uncharacterized protein n=1 Tax=Biomphalaria glabrata TaxID=6526 RepID=A0A2C9LMC3_BIOGL